jgi:hypothetical protein
VGMGCSRGHIPLVKLWPHLLLGALHHLLILLHLLGAMRRGAVGLHRRRPPLAAHLPAFLLATKTGIPPPMRPEQGFPRHRRRFLPHRQPGPEAGFPRRCGRRRCSCRRPGYAWNTFSLTQGWCVPTVR